jgi:UDP-2,4-diacetamido-2,4,6-trideoxy-beta-L-altropyranose hydrolase
VPNVVFRVDASDRIGTGHLVRCVSLAHAFRAAGATCRFLSVSDPALELARRDGFPVDEVAQAEDAAGAGPAADALATNGADLLVTDSYALTEPAKATLASFARVHVDLDDSATGGDRAADVVLNGNVYGDRARYNGPSLLLAGPAYAPLRSAFQQVPEPERRGVLVTMGGVDTPGATLAVLRVLEHVPSAEPITIVAGPRFAHRSALDAWVEAFPRKVHVMTDPEPERLRDAFASALLAVSAGGTTMLELAACGTPAVILVLADNQVEVARAFAARGAALDGGRFASFDEHRFARTLWALLHDAPARRRMAQALRGLVDGRGATRVAQAVLARLPGAGPRLRRATPDDARRVWEWRNDPVTVAQSLTPDPVPWQTHEAWYARALADPRRRLLVLEAGDGPAGIVRLDVAADAPEAEGNINPAPHVRGRGLGTSALRKALSYAHGALSVRRVTARVKAANAASLRAFEKAGFRRTRTGEITEWVHEA